ncbi:MAG TPA: GerMN domain-containing protein [Candidatus Eisenbergiella intestinipullorum]|nr:GerMN domain-containing protein [Candidatus Eisenbergiella intestinipullorum]
MTNKKKAAFLAFLTLFLLFLCGCGAADEAESGRAWQVYYLNREETSISSETIYLDEALTQDEQISALLSALQAAPENVSLKAAAGSAFQINGYLLDEGQLNIDVNGDYRKLPATTEVLVRASLVRTLIQTDGVNHVLMTVDGESLTDASGAAVGPMTADTFIDNAGDAINPYEMVTLTLYFANEAGDRLVPTTRTLEYNSNISVERLVMDCLVKGPDTDQVFPTVNPATKVLGVTVRDGICYVNLDETFLTQIYNVTPEVVIYSITNSLVELTSVNKVQLSINGQTDLIFRETFNLANLYERNLDLIAKTPSETQMETETQTEEGTQ